MKGRRAAWEWWFKGEALDRAGLPVVPADRVPGKGLGRRVQYLAVLPDPELAMV